ncbi:MAG: hypothetical protein K1X94_35760 [Sandaracinaceae bacterium]|nr:hypothetical protein [Sandaracinaceae bacterium]
MSTSRGSRLFVPLVTAGALVAAGAGAYLRAAQSIEHESTERDPLEGGLEQIERASDLATDESSPTAEALPLPARVDAIVVGGGPSPDANQLSLEEDVRLAVETFGEGSVALFAGGPGTRSVQVADLEPRGDALVSEIGELLAPRSGRDAHYRETTLALHGAGTLPQLESLLEHALAQPGPPLTVYVAGHGDGGESPVDTRVLFWGGDALDAITLAEWLDARTPTRPVRFVVTSCFSGGLGEMVFAGADRTRGVTTQDRCGLFATTWDEEASGCDPDPERAHHDGFGVHFLMALRGLDRDGADHRDEIDLDHDGTLGLYEALTHARIASRSIDIPITTSEIYLRAVTPPPPERASEGVASAPALPEQTAVIEALLPAMGLSGRAELERRLDETRARKAEHDAAMEEASAAADERYFALSAELLSRWPVLDDPFHPDFQATLERERPALERYFEASPTVRRYLEADDELSAMGSVDLAMRLELSLLRRLEMAYETVELAGRLASVGGPAWERYQALRACEQGAP